MTTIDTAALLTEKQAALFVVVEAIQQGLEIPMQEFLLRLAECTMATAEHALSTGHQMLELTQRNSENLERMRKLVEAMP